MCQNPKSHMPAPCCTQTQDLNQPPAGRPIPASSGSEMRTCIPPLLLRRSQRRFKAQKSPLGYRSTPTGLKRLKTQNTASCDCNAKWERPYLALPNLYTSANSFRKKNSSTLPILVEVRRIELRSKAIPWQVSPSSVVGWLSNASHPTTRVRHPSWFGLSLRHTNHVRRSISLE